jgi:choline dehydrogenase
LTEQILFEGSRAVGIAYRRGGRLHTLRAAREIVLCGGAVNSPQLLLLSGIGPQQRLGELGIPVVRDLPGVGQSLQDHYSAPLKFKCKLPITVNDVMLSNLKKLRVGMEYYLFKKGPLAMCTSPAALFARTRPELASPDVKLSIQPFSADRPQDGLHPWSGFSTIVYQLRPESRGYITIKSANPADPPAVYPNYLSAETDQRTMVDGLNLCRRILAQPQFRPFLELEIMPGAGVRSDDELLAFARQRGGTVFHPTSTCKMGVDAMAVVDPELRVRGVEGLRVADASVMPTVVSGNTNAATIMIGERAADLVRKERARLAA